MIKQKHLNRWLWRWHIIAGLITLPIVILLSITGIFYLFKSQYEEANYKEILFIEPPAITQALLTTPLLKKDSVSLQQQFQIANSLTDKHIMQVFLPESERHTTGFRLHNKGHTRDVIYINPYSGETTGQINQKETLMYKIRKLHGELLLNTPGTLVVELVASWFIVLILTGIYVWWPAKKFSLSGFFTIRLRSGQKAFFRDSHSVLGFWLSIFMLAVLAGGMPWTDVFGTQLKWVQEKTHTGYPQQWRNSKGLHSIIHKNNANTLPLDKIATIAKEKALLGSINIKIPMDQKGVYTIKNRSFWLSDQKVFHLDQYSGKVLQAYDWTDVGFLMDLRQVAMRFHQGQYGLVNWWVMLILTIIFTLSTTAGLCSYLIRKPKGRWGLPTVPESFKPGSFIVFLIIGLAFLFPLFGASLLVICALELIQIKKWSTVFST